MMLINCVIMMIMMMLINCGLQHVRLPVDSVRPLPGPTLLAEGPLAAADADAAPHTSRPAAEINGAGDPPPTVSSTRRGPRSHRAHRPRSKTTYLLQCSSSITWCNQMLLAPEFHHRQHRPRCGSAYRPFPADIARCTSDQ